MRYTIHYFAVMRDQRGLEQEDVESQCRTVGELYESLVSKHDFTLSSDSLKVAINDDFATWDSPLSDGDEVAFIPPVAGG